VEATGGGGKALKDHGRSSDGRDQSVGGKRKICGTSGVKNCSARMSSDGSCGSGRKDRWRRAEVGLRTRPERERGGGEGMAKS
jgi:hypothetical protein